MKQEEFIDTLSPLVVRLQRETGLPAAAVLAQAALETGWGRHVVGNNLFGIKWTGDGSYVDAITTEYERRLVRTVKAKFMSYNNFYDCLEHYAEIIRSPRYKLAYDLRHNPEAYALALQICGWATDPNYGSKIVSIMKSWDLVKKLGKGGD